MPVRTTVRPLLVAVDGTAESLKACDFAYDEAARRRSRLLLVHAYGPIVGDDQTGGFFGEPEMRQEGYRILRDAAKHLQHLGAASDQIDLRLVRGRMTRVVADASRDAQLVLLGRHESAALLPTAGSKAVGLAAASSCPVVVVPSTYDSTQTGAIVVGVDTVNTSQAAVRYAFSEAAARDAQLVAVHAWTLEAHAMTAETEAVWREQAASHAKRLLNEVTESAREEFPNVEVDLIAIEQDAAVALLDESADAQLLVVGTTGEGGVSNVAVGSVARFAIAVLQVPTVVVPSVSVGKLRATGETVARRHPDQPGLPAGAPRLG